MQEPSESCRVVRGSWGARLNSPWSSLLKGRPTDLIFI
nr:MAG TPA: hypothetical protein [Caudoviricetes sp.]